MKAFQDRYYEAVGRPCGLLRKGPGHERLTTKQYAARKAGAKARAEEQLANLRFETKLEEREQALEAQARRVAADKNSLNKKEAEVTAREETVLSREREVEARESSLKERDERATQREAAIRAREEEIKSARERAEAFNIGLELIRADLLRWVPDKKDGRGRLVYGPRDAAERPLPLKMHARLEPAMSLLEILLKIIAEIIEDALRERRREIARDAETVAECRRQLGLQKDPLVAKIVQRNNADPRSDV